jgi:pimeloyl-ACP methyl ester carboxylesterase
MARLPEITVPTLILWGRQDALLPVRLSSVFAEKLPHATVIVYDHCGHIPMEEMADRSADDVRAFVEGAPVKNLATDQHH